MKNILVLQHIAVEDPGYLKDLMQADGWQLTQIELDEGETIPADLDRFDAMLCMGGPMDTWMEDEYPWLVEEKRRIREWVVDLQKPFLGFCLGCQLLGEVLGGKVQPSNPAEIGVLDIDMTAAAREDALEGNAEVTLLGSSASTRYQIFKYREHAYAIQFHVEVRADTVEQWGCIPEYKAALENSLGADALAGFEQAARAAMPQMNRLAQLLHENFKRLL